MVDENGDWGYGKDALETELMQRAVVNKLTLHPTLPFIGLLSVQKAEILVRALDSGEADDQEEDVEEAKSPGIELFLFLQPQPRPVCEVNYCDRAAQD